MTLVVAAAPACSGDQLGRIVAEALSRILESPMRVENIGGDSGVIGTNAIAAAARDGTMLGLALSSAMIGGQTPVTQCKVQSDRGFPVVHDRRHLSRCDGRSGKCAAAGHRVVASDRARDADATGVWRVSERVRPVIWPARFLRMAQGARLVIARWYRRTKVRATCRTARSTHYSTAFPTRGSRLRVRATESSR